MEKIHYIREIMQRQGVSYAELAERCGVTKSAVASYLCHDIRLSKAKCIADALGVTLPALFIEPKPFTQSAVEESSFAYIRCPECGAELKIWLESKDTTV